MNSSNACPNSNLAGVAWRSQMKKDTTMVYVSVAAVMSAMLIQVFFSLKLSHIRRLFTIFIPTPTKLITFLILGQAPLRYFGFLDHISLIHVVGVAGFGGFGLSVLYVFHERSLPPSKVPEASNDRSKEIKLDRALQEKITFLLVCEIYHTIVGVVIGVLVMRLLKLCAIDHKHLDLLIAAGLFGPTIFFALFISMTGIVFGVSWCLQNYRNWWNGWTMH